MKAIVSVMIVSILMLIGMAGAQVQLSTLDNQGNSDYMSMVNAIFNSKEMNGPFAVDQNATLNWTIGDKPVRAVDGTPTKGVSEQALIDAKNDAFLERADPYAQKVNDGTIIHSIDGSWNVQSEETMANKVLEDFMNK